MTRDEAYKMIRALGASTKKIMAERGHKLGQMSDLFAGIGGVVTMKMTDDDIPGITEAHAIVMKDCTDAGFEMFARIAEGKMANA